MQQLVHFADLCFESHTVRGLQVSEQSGSQALPASCTGTALWCGARCPPQVMVLCSVTREGHIASATWSLRSLSILIPKVCFPKQGPCEHSDFFWFPHSVQKPCSQGEGGPGWGCGFRRLNEVREQVEKEEQFPAAPPFQGLAGKEHCK